MGLKLMKTEPAEPPYSLIAEQSVLGCCLLENNCIDDVAMSLTREDFYELRHCNLFDLIVKMRDEGKFVEPATILQESKDLMHGGVESVGGIAYVSSLQNQVPSPVGLPSYLSTVIKKSKLRSLVSTAQQVLSIAGKKGDDESLLDEAEEKLMTLLSSDRGGGVAPLSDVIKETLKDIEDAYANQGKLTGIPTGFTYLDKLTTGFKKGDMIVLAARPSQGKTSLAMTIAENTAINGKISTGILSLEMTSRSLIKRMMGSMAGVDGHNIMTGKLAEDEIRRLTNASVKIGNSPLHIDQSGNLSITQMASKARHLKYKYGIKFLIIDYLQLIHAKADSRVQEVTKISAAVKAVAKELDIPVLVLSQLSRRVEEQDRSPRLSDLRDSGSIEQDADVVALLHKTNEKNIVEVIVAKHRNGPCGAVELEFVPHLTRFKTAIYGMDNE